MSAIHFIASICHPGKLGLLDHALALRDFGKRHDPARRYAIIHTPDELAALANDARARGGMGLVVIWDNSLRSLRLAGKARRLGCKAVYYYHEPGGFGQKIHKADPFFYSLKATLGEWVFQRCTDFQVVARPDKIGFADWFCPLLFDEQRPPRAPLPRRIGFLGARRNQRLHNLFTYLRPTLASAGYEVAYFPSPEHGRSTEEKFRFLSLCTVVWNAYGVPYNQSGVTGDCLMSGTPMILSAYEPYRALLVSLDLGIELDLMQPAAAMGTRLVGQLAELERRQAARQTDQARHALVQAQSAFGGSQAFQAHWMSFFDAVAQDGIAGR